MADTARPRAGEEHDALAPKPGQRPVGADNAPGAALPGGAGARPRPVRVSPAALQRLGGAAGNRAVANLLRPARGGPAAPLNGAAHAEAPAAPATDPAVVIQRYAGIKGGGGSFAPPAPPVPPNPKGDPKFLKVAVELKKAAKETKKHPPGKAEAKKAADAAKPPANDKEAQAKAGQADKMAGAKKGGFDKAAFIAAVKQAIAAAAPKNLDEADKFAESGKAEGVKTQVMDKVAKGKDESAKDVAEKAKEPPDPSKAVEKPVTPLPEEKEPKPPTPEFSKAMPAKVPPEQTNFEGPKNEVDAKMAEADITESDLKKSNEPQMMAAAEAKKEGEAHSAKAPGEIRAKEAEVLKGAEGAAGQKGKGGLEGMVGAKKNALAQAAAKKSDQKTKDEAKRAEIAAELNKIYDRTKTDVEKRLTDLDAKVDKAFSDGEAQVRRAFTSEHKAGLERFKRERYAGASGTVQWGLDLFTDLNELPEVKRIYDTAKANYERGMEKVISNVADLVGTEVDAAKERIVQGRQEIKDWVAKQPKEVQKLAAEAAKGMDEKFNQLESDVDAKSESLASDLAEKYTTALGEVNNEIEAAQAENRSAWSKAKDAVGESIEAILKLKDLFMGMLAKAAGAFKKIIADPLAFIGNFLGAVKAGFLGFAAKIGEHLKKGLQGWLFGKLGEAGIEIPDKLDLAGILKMVLSILGLTWAAVRPKIVKIVGEKAMGVLETTADVFVILVKEGIPGLWKWIVDKVGDLKEMVIGQIRNFVIEKIVKAGITWVIGMLNPAGALIKIIQTLISVIQWIMEKGAALVELVGTIIDSVSDIANGGMGGVPAKIEGALAKAVPIVISFLASLLGLGGIGEKIKSILDTVRGPVGKAVDAVIAGAVKITKPIWGAIKKGGAWAKKKVDQAKDYVKKKYEQGKAWVKEKAKAGLDWTKAKARSTKEAVVSLFKRRQESFAMEGAPHHLMAEPEPDGLNLYMQSRKQRLTEKIAAAVTALSARAAGEPEPKRAATERLIATLKSIADRARRLEQKARKSKKGQVGPTGAPPGFDKEMRQVADEITAAGAQGKMKDILAAPEGTEVDLALLSRFGMPLASYLQAQDTADDTGATIDIRPTNVQAPELLARGHLPKSKDFKEKTVNEADVELGIPKRYIGRMAWFNPLPPPPSPPAGFDEARWAKIVARFKERRDEYLSGLQDMPTRLAAGEFTLIAAGAEGTDAAGASAPKGGVVLKDALKRIAYTGDHDLFDVRPRGSEAAVVAKLKAAPFRVQHGAHLMWPMLPETLEKGGLTPHERMIYEVIIRKHGPGGEALLRVRPKEVPVTGSAFPLPALPDTEKGKSGSEVFRAEPTAWEQSALEAGSFLTESGTLINGAQAVVDPRKVFDYALNTEHPEGKHKARVFQAATGFTAESGQAVVAALIVGARTVPATPGKVDQHGTRFTLLIPIVGPTGTANMKTGWIYKTGSKIPSLTTLMIG